jgi:hypothetical protein
MMGQKAHTPTQEHVGDAPAFASHDEAMETIVGAAGVATLSYEEAIAAYLRMRGILNDGEEMLGASVPAGWTP